MTVLGKCSPDSDSEISLKIGQYLMKLRRTKQSVSVFWATLYVPTEVENNWPNGTGPDVCTGRPKKVSHYQIIKKSY